LTSSGEKLKNKYSYPSDLSSDPIHQQMINQGMLKYVVEQEEFKETKPLQGIKTSYKDWGNGVIAPEVVYVRQAASAYEPRIVYHTYDKRGNISSVSKKDDLKSNFLYSYNQSLPIAKIENADYEVISNVLGGEANIINFSKKVFPTDDEVKNFIAPLQNDIRLKHAIISTYTHKPLQGITSIIDLNKLTTYYEYDAAQRLTTIRDDERNIVKHFQYHTVNPSYLNVSKSGTFIKNDCGPDYAGGSSVTYTIHPGTYSSGISQADADMIADADISTNGQSYANENGSCYVHKNDLLNQFFTKNDCGSGFLGSEVSYSVPYAKYTSTISVADANAKAQTEIDLNGQSHANELGNCRPDVTHYNILRSQGFIKECSFGYNGNEVIYYVAAGKHSSTYSQQDADNKAVQEILVNGQSHANSTGACTMLPLHDLDVFNNSNFDAVITYSNSKGSQTHGALKGATTRISVPSDVYNIIYITLTGNSVYDFTFQMGSTSVIGSQASFSNTLPASIRIF
jgi:hypothetical protein